MFRLERSLKLQGGSLWTSSLTPDRQLLISSKFTALLNDAKYIKMVQQRQLSRRGDAHIPTTRTTLKAITISLRKAYSAYTKATIDVIHSCELGTFWNIFSFLMARRHQFLCFLLTILYAGCSTNSSMEWKIVQVLLCRHNWWYAAVILHVGLGWSFSKDYNMMSIYSHMLSRRPRCINRCFLYFVKCNSLTELLVWLDISPTNQKYMFFSYL